MQIIRDLPALRACIDALRHPETGTRQRIALVPTMGALHAGHMALVDEARAHADHVIVSIFVNPMQFAPNEDLDAYPRREGTDTAMLTEARVSALWMPPVDVMYPQGFTSCLSLSGLTDMLEGASRPGHFDGVATVVAKLFNQVQPDIAVFGEKDYQQLAVIRAMARDMDFAVEIIGLPTQRDEDGLALSSRNTYLTPEERKAALALPRALGDAARRIESGESVADALARATSALTSAGFDPIDYVTLCDAVTLEAMETLDRPARLLAAARMGQTRLIDNLAVVPMA